MGGLIGGRVGEQTGGWVGRTGGRLQEIFADANFPDARVGALLVGTIQVIAARQRWPWLGVMCSNEESVVCWTKMDR